MTAPTFTPGPANSKSGIVPRLARRAGGAAGGADVLFAAVDAVSDDVSGSGRSLRYTAASRSHVATFTSPWMSTFSTSSVGR